MLASASRLMATTLRAPEIPAMCCTAPLMPIVMYRSGATVAPVRPTWWDGATAEDWLGDDELAAIDPQGSRVGHDAAVQSICERRTEVARTAGVRQQDHVRLGLLGCFLGSGQQPLWRRRRWGLAVGHQHSF